MYIPTQFFGGANNCVSASSTADVKTHLIISESLYKVDIFQSTGNHTYSVHTGSANYKVILVGGGGAGGKQVYQGTRNAGGGGAGNFVYLDNLIFVSGSYPIYVGAGGAEPTITPNNGQASTLEYIFEPTNGGTYPISGTTLSAAGGGGGACISGSIGVRGQDGASGGGGAAWGTGAGPTYTVSNGVALYNPLDLPPHGFDGGAINGAVLIGGGGGGASNSASLNSYSPGGGISADFTGFPQYFSEGGYGGDGTRTRVPSNSSGSGGSATFENDTASNRALSKGKNGLVVLMHELCSRELSQCTTYTFDGGLTGGTLTYIECNTGLLTSSSIDFDQQGVICTLPITYGIGSNTKTYPQVTGTVTITPTGSCDLNVDIPIVPTCDTGSGETKSELYLYDWTTAGNLGPPYYWNMPVEIIFTNSDGELQVYTTSGWSPPASGQFCARPEPAPTSVGIYGVGSLTQSSTVCAYFCSSSLTPQCETWRFQVSYDGDTGYYVDCNGLIQKTSYITSGSYVDVCIDVNYTPISYNSIGNWTQISPTCP